MNESELVSPIIKEYISKFDLEEVLNEVINDVMIMMPEDPFASLSKLLNEVI